jgi:hypothetical protein
LTRLGPRSRSIAEKYRASSWFARTRSSSSLEHAIDRSASTTSDGAPRRRVTAWNLAKCNRNEKCRLDRLRPCSHPLMVLESTPLIAARAACVRQALAHSESSKPVSELLGARTIDCYSASGFVLPPNVMPRHLSLAGILPRRRSLDKAVPIALGCQLPRQASLERIVQVAGADTCCLRRSTSGATTKAYVGGVMTSRFGRKRGVKNGAPRRRRIMTSTTSEASAWTDAWTPRERPQDAPFGVTGFPGRGSEEGRSFTLFDLSRWGRLPRLPNAGIAVAKAERSQSGNGSARH